MTREKAKTPKARLGCVWGKRCISRAIESVNSEKCKWTTDNWTTDNWTRTDHCSL